MNRKRPQVNQKSFISGGVYDPNSSIKKQNAQQKSQQSLVGNNSFQQQRDEIMEQTQENVPPLEPPPENPFKDSNLSLDTAGLVDTNGKVKFKKLFGNRKKPSVRAKEKRIRQNRRLRKAIIPKNALMALNELKGISISEFTINSSPGGGFTALVTVNNTQYEGRGISKILAKNNACEKALRDFIIAKLREKPRNQKAGGINGEPMDTGDDTQNSSNAENDDDVPMVNLASFAIYKLFSEWEHEGYVIPEMHPAAGGSTSENECGGVTQGCKEIKKVTIRNELPQNYEAMHPASLLCVMRPGVTYVDKGTTGEKPNVIQSLGVTIDNQEFVASGRSKKLARRNVAALACNTLFNTSFELNISNESGGGN